MKKTKLLSLTVISLIFSFNIYAQKCSCESNFLWAKKTFEENDAGFKYIIDKKGKDSYDLHTKTYLEKVKKLQNDKQCAETIDKWIRFFRNGHIGVSYLKEQKVQKTVTSEQLVITEIDFKKYLDTNNLKNKFEGIWTFGSYTIGIKQAKNGYVGFILSSKNKNWKTFDVKATFNESEGIIYSGDKSPKKIRKITTIGNTYLTLDDLLLTKIYPKNEERKEVEVGMQQLYTQEGNHYFERLNDSTTYLRITLFDNEEKREIDSILAKNKDIILSTKNLIIDVRNNPGGSDRSYRELIPFLYTNPIRTVSGLFYSTKLNNEKILNLSKSPYFDEDARKEIKWYYDSLITSVGQFVNIFGKDVDVQDGMKVTTYPQSIGIIINEKNGSTTEQFLLTAKQSKKVKLFGRTTFGMLDISNVNEVESPCGDIKLFYGMSKSFRIPGFAIDDIGLQPDFFIDDTIQPYDWVTFTEKVLNGK